ncbi:MAG: sulfite exporter TauE/SafE family protein [Bacteroidia bacterium]|nr:sulfite exporter TauE/SafE family protein [Bacteroidia bacterium]
MSESLFIIALLLFFIIAALYSSIGHAGASGYLAVMALLSFAPESIKPTSLILNIVVAAIASYKFIKEGYFDRRIFISFILFSLPAAFIGGYITVSSLYFKILAGLFLIVSSILIVLKKKTDGPVDKHSERSLVLTGIIGVTIGFISGIIGVGGGIFLTPVLIMMNWTTVKKASGISALFILCNSISGLLGHLSSLPKIDSNIAYWVIAVALGGALGSYFGTKKFNNRIIIWCLFLVLLSAGLKFILVDAFK